MKELYQAVRYYLTGTDVGAGIPETIVTLGRPTVLARLKRAESDPLIA